MLYLNILIKKEFWHPYTDILTFYLNEFMEEHVQQLRFLQCLFCVVDYARVCSLQSGTLNHRVEACIIDTQDHGEYCRRNRLHMSLKSMTKIAVMKIWGRAWVMGVPKAVGGVYNGLKH